MSGVEIVITGFKSREFSIPSLALALFLLGGCDSAAPSRAEPSPVDEENVAAAPETASNPLSRPLALARLTAARTAPADQALPLLVSALKADPASEEVRRELHLLLSHTRWHFPISRLDQGFPIEQIAVSRDSLWIGVTGGGGQRNLSTAVRWGPSLSAVESVLFPLPDAFTIGLHPSPDGRFLIHRRKLSSSTVNLLCDAASLQPICEIGPLPLHVPSGPLIAWSDDGLLFAHPTEKPETWLIRDATSGQVIRSAKLPVSSLAARWEGNSLHVLHSDSSLSEVPFSPVEEAVHHPAPAEISVLAAFFPDRSREAIAVIEQPPGPALLLAPDSIDPAETLLTLPWSRHPSLWSHLTGRVPLPLEVGSSTASFPGASRAPVHADSEITAAAFSEDRLFMGTEKGTLEIHLLLPLPAISGSTIIGEGSLDELESLSIALSGLSLDETNSTFSSVHPASRRQAIESLSSSSLARSLTGLDFSPLLKEISRHPWHEAPPDAIALLRKRFDRADPSSFPAEDHQRISRIFASEEPEIILNFLNQLPAEQQAVTLSLALEAGDPRYLEALLSNTESMPPLLRRISETHLAWRTGGKAAAIAAWPAGLPDLGKVRLSEDWEGWETVDFTPHVASLQSHFDQELAPLSLPVDSTPEQRAELAERLLSPATRATVGKEPHSTACLNAAFSLAVFPEEASTAYQLATLALTLGADPPRCFRAQATALTRMGDFQQAHQSWITLIGEFPEHTHLSGDYAEAAYTAFENGNGDQAMNILAAGLHRFPADAHFALRAGWVSLLIGQPEPAYRFLLAGESIGYPEDKKENGLALLAIAANQAGYAEEAWDRFQKLVEFDAAWADPATLETLDWPEGLKAALRQLTW